MNGFRKMQEALSREGWFVGWNLPCCQSCAWGELSWMEHAPEDMSKVLFNHSQDCVVEGSDGECSECYGDGLVENPDVEEQLDAGDYDAEEFIDCPECGGTGEIEEGFDSSEYDTSIGGFVCNYPEQQDGSCFCFDGSEEGIDNFKAVIPLIEASGCKVKWNGSGGQRPYISWKRG